MDKNAALSPELLQIIENKHTEAPFSGEYCTPQASGTYLCRRCGLALFRAHDQFHSGCGWPSFDSEIPEHVLRLPDKDGFRTEILCSRCEAHLGHVFEGEELTARNTRHCVNSLSLDFVTDSHVLNTEEAILAAGCFWGVEYYFKKLPGVLKTEIGYSGGESQNPTYQEVCQSSKTLRSSHLEVIRVIFDPLKLNYADLLKFFFEIHDPTQKDGQGPDKGAQYLSAIFYYTLEQKKTAESVMQVLKDKNKNKEYEISTTLRPATTFWPGEIYHQNYYAKTGSQPYCHRWTKKF